MELGQLSETLVKRLADSPESFLKGQHYAELGAVQNLELKENILTGEVTGNHGIYVVKVIFETSGSSFECTCGSKKTVCKHTLAVLWDFLSKRPALV